MFINLFVKVLNSMVFFPQNEVTPFPEGIAHNQLYVLLYVICVGIICTEESVLSIDEDGISIYKGYVYEIYTLNITIPNLNKITGKRTKRAKLKFHTVKSIK